MRLAPKTSLVAICAYLAASGFALGQFSHEEVIEKCKLALMRIQDSPALRVEFFVQGPASEGEYTLELRSDSCWLEGVRTVGIDRSARTATRAEFDKLRGVTGVSRNLITSFNGRELAIFNPLELEATLRPAPEFVGDKSVYSLFPYAWVAFHQFKVEQMKFVNLFEESVDRTVEWKEEHRLLRVTERTSDSVDGYSERWIEIDTQSGFLVTRYELAGGRLGRMQGEFDWEEVRGNWFPRKGRQTTNGVLVSNWEISEISFDAKDVRTSFSMTATELPFGTKISRLTADYRQRAAVEPQFVGGAAGEKEYQLRRLAITNVRRKK